MYYIQMKGNYFDLFGISQILSGVIYLNLEIDILKRYIYWNEFRDQKKMKNGLKSKNDGKKLREVILKKKIEERNEQV